MTTFTDSLQLIDLELFDAAFAITPGTENEVKRRFMTLFAHEDGQHRGGSAEVCRVTNTRGETFALKRLRASEVQQPARQESAAPTRKELRHSASGSDTPVPTPEYVTPGHVTAFYEEYRIHLAVSRLRGFPQLYGFGLERGNPIILMEWVEGPSLRDALRERSLHEADLLPLAVVARLGLAVIDHLQRASELSEHFVHRDLSPRNIMLRTDCLSAREQLARGDFDLCLVDFGSSSLRDAGRSDPTFTARTGMWRMGTPAYAPPEMLTSDVALPDSWRQSAAIDVYALGSILYELYAGRRPYDLSPTDERTPYRIKTEDPPAPLTPRTPDGGALAEVICCCLATQPDERPTLGELEVALRNWLELPGEHRARLPRQARGHAASLWQPEHARRTLTRRRLLSIGIVGAAALASGALVSSKLLGSRPARLDPSRYRRASAPYDGEPLFRAYDGSLGGWGLYTAAGDVVCRPSSSRPCGPLREGLVALYDDLSQRYGFVTPTDDADGYAWAILPAFAQVGDFSEGLAAAQDPTSSRWGLVDTTGAWAIGARLGDTGSCSQGCIAARQADDQQMWGILDRTGAWLVEPRFAAVGTRAEDGHAVAQDASGGWGIVDADGAWTCPAASPRMRRYAFGLAPAFDEDDATWGYVDAQGAWTIPARFADARPFQRVSNGHELVLAAVQDVKTGLWQFVEPDGAPHTAPRLWKLGDLRDGLAPAQATPEDDTIAFDPSDRDARAEGVGMRYGYVDGEGAWQMRRLTTLTDTAIGIPGI